MHKACASLKEDRDRTGQPARNPDAWHRARSLRRPSPEISVLYRLPYRHNFTLILFRFLPRRRSCPAPIRNGIPSAFCGIASLPCSVLLKVLVDIGFSRGDSVDEFQFCGFNWSTDYIDHRWLSRYFEFLGHCRVIEFGNRIFLDQISITCLLTLRYC